MVDAYRRTPLQFSVLERRNGHVVAACRDARGRWSYVCVLCGRSYPPITWGRNVSQRVPDSIPLDPCPHDVGSFGY